MCRKGSGNIVTKANIGCGFDIKPGWVNIDAVELNSPDFYQYEILTPSFIKDFSEEFDFALVNHVLCTMTDEYAHYALKNIYDTIQPSGKLQVIDMDILKVFKSYQEGRIDDIPIEQGTIDERLCYAISGYGTRLSLYTPLRMKQVLIEAGFRIVMSLSESEYDTRPKESLIVEAIK
jgi:hypothetical protein